MALVVVMPVVSRSMPMAGTMSGAAASTMLGMDMSGCPGHATDGARQQPGSPHAPSDPMERCGYCYLIGHSPLLVSSAIVHRVPMAPMAMPSVVALPRHRPVALLLIAAPRGPPFIA